MCIQWTLAKKAYKIVYVSLITLVGTGFCLCCLSGPVRGFVCVPLSVAIIISLKFCLLLTTARRPAYILTYSINMDRTDGSTGTQRLGNKIGSYSQLLEHVKTPGTLTFLSTMAAENLFYVSPCGLKLSILAQN